MPERVQRKRTKGWKMPPNTIYVGRPTKFGNPFKGEHAKDSFEQLYIQIIEDFQNQKTLSFDKYCATYRGTGAPRFDRIHELKGKNLACWCALDKPCHADILLKLANEK